MGQCRKAGDDRRHLETHWMESSWNGVRPATYELAFDGKWTQGFAERTNRGSPSNKEGSPTGSHVQFFTDF